MVSARLAAARTEAGKKQKKNGISFHGCRKGGGDCRKERISPKRGRTIGGEKETTVSRGEPTFENRGRGRAFFVIGGKRQKNEYSRDYDTKKKKRGERIGLPAEQEDDEKGESWGSREEKNLKDLDVKNEKTMESEPFPVRKREKRKRETMSFKAPQAKWGRRKGKVE